MGKSWVERIIKLERPTIMETEIMMEPVAEAVKETGQHEDSEEK
jgi:hypothetical protein